MKKFTKKFTKINKSYSLFIFTLFFNDLCCRNTTKFRLSKHDRYTYFFNR